MCKNVAMQRKLKTFCIFGTSTSVLPDGKIMIEFKPKWSDEGFLKINWAANSDINFRTDDIGSMKTFSTFHDLESDRK